MIIRSSSPLLFGQGSWGSANLLNDGWKNILKNTQDCCGRDKCRHREVDARRVIQVICVYCQCITMICVKKTDYTHVIWYVRIKMFGCGVGPTDEFTLTDTTISSADVVKYRYSHCCWLLNYFTYFTGTSLWTTWRTSSTCVTAIPTELK